MKLLIMAFFSLWLTSCATTLPWPEQTAPAQTTADAQFASEAEAMAYVAGHYAHYDVVAYEEPNKKKPMRTFVISYGFTDFEVIDGQLIQSDRFCHAEQKINYKSVVSSFNDDATQAILPNPQAVELNKLNNQWQLYRPPTPTLLGIKGDASQPLSRDANDEQIFDADGDGQPGVTVDIVIGGFINGEIYLTRREIFENFVTVKTGGQLIGHVKDSSEQFVIGASLKALLKSTEPVQVSDVAMNPLVLVKISPELNSCAELMARRDEWFPPEPTFY